MLKYIAIIYIILLHYIIIHYIVFVLLILIFFSAEVSETVLEEPIQILPPNDDGIIFFYQQLKLKNQIYLYSIDFEVTVDPLREVDHTKPETVYERCILAFLGENYEAVAFTDVYR